LKHFLTFLPDAYLATKIPDMSGKNLTYGNPTLVFTRFPVKTDQVHDGSVSSGLLCTGLF